MMRIVKFSSPLHPDGAHRLCSLNPLSWHRHLNCHRRWPRSANDRTSFAITGAVSSLRCQPRHHLHVKHPHHHHHYHHHHPHHQRPHSRHPHRCHLHRCHRQCHRVLHHHQHRCHLLRRHHHYQELHIKPDGICGEHAGNNITTKCTIIVGFATSNNLCQANAAEVIEERMAEWMFCMNVSYEWYVIFKNVNKHIKEKE